MDAGFLTIAIIALITALTIAAIILTIQYIRVNAKTVSREQFRKETARQASRIKLRSPVISCDYCGYKIDTKKYRNCPNCGASYSRDEEWTERYGLTEDDIESKADKYAGLVNQDQTEQAEKIAGWIKKCLIALGIILGGLLISAIVSYLVNYQQEKESMYVTKSDELNIDSSDAYVPVPYGIDGDGVLIDKNGVRITVIGIYEDKKIDNSERDFKVGLRIQNESGQSISVSVTMSGANRKMGAGYFRMYDCYKDHADIIRYENIGSSLGDPEICEMLYRHIWVCGKKDRQPDAEVPLLVMKTTSAAGCTAQCPEETVIYDDHQVVILCGKDEKGNHLLWIDNRSDVNYEVTTSDLRVNGNNVYTMEGLFKDFLPAGYLYPAVRIRAADAVVWDAQPEISVSFTCGEDPSKDFSTGYLRLDP